jgi:dihydropteroate synthase
MKPIHSDYETKLEKYASRYKENIRNTALELHCRDRQIPLAGNPLLMGILNINDDSFAGDGRLDANWALARAVEMVSEGADIIDVGGESARTNRAAISEEEELARIRPFLENFSKAMRAARPRTDSQVFPPLLSLNTWRPNVVKGALTTGFDILNDMSALPSETNAIHCASIGAALLIMHSKGEPKIAHKHITYPDVMDELLNFFREKTAIALHSGVKRESLILDPGIDFAKQAPDNLRIYRELEKLTTLGFPILLPVSRKSVIGRVLGIERPQDRDAGTIACIVAGCLRGASIFRIHNVSAAWFAIRTAEVLQ